LIGILNSGLSAINGVGRLQTYEDTLSDEKNS